MISMIIIPEKLRDQDQQKIANIEESNSDPTLNISQDINSSLKENQEQKKETLKLQ